jgi:hypothetical protein
VPAANLQIRFGTAIALGVLAMVWDRSHGALLALVGQ